MGSAEGFGAGGVVVKQVPREIQAPCSSVVQKDKPQILKQRNSSNCKRGDKRSSKVQKTRCDSFSLRSGLVGFNSAAGGNNFFGLYGLKPDAFDITKYVDELSLDDLLRGTSNCPDIAKEKGKAAAKPAKPNNDLLSSVRKACSILQTRKVPHGQKCVEIDNSFIEKISAGLVDVSSVGGQTNGDNVDSCTKDLTSSHEVQEQADKGNTCLIADSQVYQPKDILQRLALPPPKDLDLLLSDASKGTSSSKYSTDLRLGKSVSHRTGLPPFSWSHAFSGHNKLGADAGKLSSNRATCPGRWAKVRNSVVLQKGCADLLVDFESLTFDQNLVPKVNPSPEHSSHLIERRLTSSAACLTVDVPAVADLPSPSYTAAQTICDIMATCSPKENSHSMKSLHKPMKGCKLKSIEKSDRLFDPTRPKPHTLKVGENALPSKRLKLSPDVPKLSNGHIDSPRKGTSHWSAPQTYRSPPSKLFRDSNLHNNNMDFVKTSYMMKPPRAVDRPSSSQQKLKKAVPMKWSRPES